MAGTRPCQFGSSRFYDGGGSGMAGLAEVREQHGRAGRRRAAAEADSTVTKMESTPLIASGKKLS